MPKLYILAVTPIVLVLGSTRADADTPKPLARAEGYVGCWYSVRRDQG